MSWWADDDEDDDDEFDESSIRVRPNPKGNRPRTKTRPEHKDAVAGRIMTVDRGRFSVLIDQDTPEEREITASRARELGRTPIVTGDWVDLVETPPARRARCRASCACTSGAPCCAAVPTTRMPSSA